MTLSSVGKVDVKKLKMKIRLQNPNSTGEGVRKVFLLKKLSALQALQNYQWYLQTAALVRQ